MKNLIRYKFILILTISIYSCCNDDVTFYNVEEIIVNNFNIESQENTNSVNQQSYALRVILDYYTTKADNGVWCRGYFESINDVTGLNLIANNAINGILPGESLNELFKLKINNTTFNDFTVFFIEANDIEFKIYDFIFDDSITIDTTTTSFTIELMLADDSIVSATSDLVSIN